MKHAIVVVLGLVAGAYLGALISPDAVFLGLFAGGVVAGIVALKLFGQPARDTDTNAAPWDDDG